MSFSQDMDIDTVTADPTFDIHSILTYSKALLSNPLDEIPSSSTDPPGLRHAYLLPYCLKRLLASAQALKWYEVEKYLESPNALYNLALEIDSHISSEYTTITNTDTNYIVRLGFSRTSGLKIKSAPRPEFALATALFYPTQLPPPSCLSNSGISRILHVDPEPTLPSLFTIHKTTYRQPYNLARARTGITDIPFSEAEVLLVNDRGEIMGGGFTTVYLWRLIDGAKGEWGWVTPAAECGGKIGVSRMWALRCAAVIEGIVKKDDLVDGEVVWLSSGSRGFVVAKLMMGDGSAKTFDDSMLVSRDLKF